MWLSRLFDFVTSLFWLLLIFLLIVAVIQLDKIHRKLQAILSALLNLKEIQADETNHVKRLYEEYGKAQKNTTNWRVA